MNYLKNLLWLLLGMVVVYAVLDFFNVSGWLMFPYTTVKGYISGKHDPTVAAINSPAQTN